LRAHAGTADAAAIEACLGSLLAATDDYLRRREVAHQGFEELYKDRSEFQGVRESVRQAIASQDDQIRSSTDLARAFDYQNDIESGCRRMVGETGKLLGANHRLRDAMGAAMVEVARHEQRLAEIDPDLCRDPLTGILDRTGLEARLRAWWKQDPHRMRVLSAALIDVDRFAQLNESFGCQVGDQVLRTIAQCLESEQRGQSVAARFSGQCFFFLFGDVDLRSAINVVERIRQGIELWRFRRRDAEIRITVSCAVVEATAEDTSETLFARAEATLREAKRYGRNRTFLHEGKYPTPVVPPSFSLEAKQIDL
jgi:diguanylate cyclase